MKYTLKNEDGYSYLESGEGTPLIILHGLMGNLSNFDGVFDHFSDLGYQVIMPELPIYTLPLLKTNVKNLSKFIKDFVKYKGLDKYILMGNSLGGHIALFHTKLNPKNVTGLVLTGSSGLYENSMGESYPKRGDYEYIKKKAQDVFYDPEVATPEIIDDVFDTLNNRNKLIRTIAIAKSAIRHNMGKDLPTMTVPTCLIWGKNDSVTPPEVAEEFDKLLPNSELHWIDKCGHAPMMERPIEFNEKLEPWLTKHFGTK
ncbi:alpha/beta hydrolase [Lutimonas halocynthiae]|uniref:alpha/beta fold hydrolase n=1 Tax=Lutimonas halocynthiae TaxID=1446477 RepID=UPI0025B5D0DB|nr:alpha/beta hydrolase [Lutimonas halocynthiae]MDN3642545.1 alpha/beta hydrolase [Lutimonas halocynthiae]